VGFVDPARIDLQRRRAAATVSETPGHRADVDARGDELGYGVVAQLVQAGAVEL
jgi:hypothetical protein